MNVCATYEEILSRCSWSIALTRTGRTDWKHKKPNFYLLICSGVNNNVAVCALATFQELIRLKEVIGGWIWTPETRIQILFHPVLLIVEESDWKTTWTWTFYPCVDKKKVSMFSKHMYIWQGCIFTSSSGRFLFDIYCCSDQ